MSCVKAMLISSACAMAWIVGIGNVAYSPQPPAHVLSNRNSALIAANVRPDSPEWLSLLLNGQPYTSALDQALLKQRNRSLANNPV